MEKRGLRLRYIKCTEWTARMNFPAQRGGSIFAGVFAVNLPCSHKVTGMRRLMSLDTSLLQLNQGLSQTRSKARSCSGLTGLAT